MDVNQNRNGPAAAISSACLSSGRWPARAQRSLELGFARCVDWLHEPLQRCLGEFEQQLFDRADHAHHAAEQQDCFVSRQRVQQDRAALEQRFFARIAIAFDTVDDRSRAEQKGTPGETKPWRQLELLDPAEHELSMTLEQFGFRGDARHSGVLSELGYRLGVLMAAPLLEGEALPLGPHALAAAFHHASAPLDLPLAHQLALLQSFDHNVIQAMAPLLDAINAQLQADGILPQLRNTPVLRHTSRPYAVPLGTAAEASGETHASGGNQPRPESIAVLESLRNMLAQQRTGHGAAAGQAAGRAASAEELQTALGALQQHLAVVTDQASRELRSAQRLREELLTQLNIGTPNGAPRTQLSSEQGDTVELVALLFEQLGQQLHRDGSAHALLGGLQLPLLRMAVTDRGFFEQHEHPARQLLDTVTATANEWLDGSDDESNRPLATKLNQLVARANQEPPSTDLYADLLADIKHHVELLNRRAQAAEQRHLEAALGRERLEQARRRAAELMAVRFAQSPPRGLLRTLLDRAWSDVLALTLLRHGEDSEAFDAQLAVTDQLLGRLPVDDRGQLQQDVETGLQQIGMHAEEAEQVAQRLLGSQPLASSAGVTPELPSATDIAIRLKQHQRLGEHSSQAPDAAQAAPSTGISATATASKATASGVESNHPAAAPAAVDPREQAIQQRLRQLPFGVWFEFANAAGDHVIRRKLAWYSPMSGRCLLVTRRGQLGQEMTLTQLAHDIARGRVHEVAAPPKGLLDRAWSGLTGALRQPAASVRAAAQGGYRP